MLRRLAPLVVLIGCVAGDSKSRTSTTTPADTRRTVAPLPDSIRRPPAPLVSPPDTLRGLYVNRWAAIGSKMWELIDLAKRTEVNALVIDVKDDRGFMLYRSDIPLAREISADTTRPMSYKRIRAILDTMRQYRIYPIARIVVGSQHARRGRWAMWASVQNSPTQPATRYV